MKKLTKEDIVYPVAFYSVVAGIICFMDEGHPGIWASGMQSKHTIDSFIHKHNEKQGRDYAVFMPASAADNTLATKEALLEQVGSLYNRNKSLTKGHATLTRRVQDLEKELAYYRQKYPRTLKISDEGMTIKEGEHTLGSFGKLPDQEPEQKQGVFLGDRQVTVNKESTADAIIERAIASMQDSKLFEDLRAEQQNRQTAEAQLQEAVADIKQRVNRIEDGAQFAFGRRKGATEFQRLLEQAITKGMQKALQPGGVLFTALRK